MNLFDTNAAGNPVTRRARLIDITRRAFIKWNKATLLHAARVTSLTPSRSCIDESRELVLHTAARFEKFETLLATEAGVPTFTVYNAVAALAHKRICAVPLLMENL